MTTLSLYHSLHRPTFSLKFWLEKGHRLSVETHQAQPQEGFHVESWRVLRQKELDLIVLSLQTEMKFFIGAVGTDGLGRHKKGTLDFVSCLLGVFFWPPNVEG